MEKKISLLGGLHHQTPVGTLPLATTVSKPGRRQTRRNVMNSLLTDLTLVKNIYDSLYKRAFASALVRVNEMIKLIYLSTNSYPQISLN